MRRQEMERLRKERVRQDQNYVKNEQFQRKVNDYNEDFNNKINNLDASLNNKHTNAANYRSLQL